MNLTMKEVLILSVLYEKNCDRELRTMKREEILEEVCKKEKSSIYTINNGIKKLIELGYLKEGVRDGRIKMYFITENGIEFIKQKH